MLKVLEENSIKKELRNQTKNLLERFNKLPPELIEIIKNNLIDQNQLLLIKLFGTSKEFRGHKSSINSIAFSPNNKFALTGSYDETAKLWDLSNLNNIKPIELKGHTLFVISIAFSPDNKFALTGSFDKTV